MARKLMGLLFAFVFVFPPGSFAQQSASSGLVGLVTDWSPQPRYRAAPSPSRTSGTNARRTTVTNSEGGLLRFPALPARSPWHQGRDSRASRTPSCPSFVLRQ